MTKKITGQIFLPDDPLNSLCSKKPPGEVSLDQGRQLVEANFHLRRKRDFRNPEVFGKLLQAFFRGPEFAGARGNDRRRSAHHRTFRRRR